MHEDQPYSFYPPSDDENGYGLVSYQHPPLGNYQLVNPAPNSRAYPAAISAFFPSDHEA